MWLEVLFLNLQSSFIKGRQILYEILIANEMVDDDRCLNKELLLFKVDFEKAYDWVDWRVFGRSND